MVKIGSKVKNVRVGDVVAIEPGVSCFKCEPCKTGRYNLCAEMVGLVENSFRLKTVLVCNLLQNLIETDIDLNR